MLFKYKEARRHNITYTQTGVSCFVGQESSKFKAQFFVGSSVVKIPPIANTRPVIGQCKNPTRKWHIWFFRYTSQRSKKQKSHFFVNARTNEPTIKSKFDD